MIIGVCNATPLAACDRYEATPFTSRDMRKRIDPSAVMAGVQSIVVLGVGREYETNHCPSSQVQLSSLGTNPDYHPIVRAHLKNIVAELEQQHGAFKHKILVDSGTLDERAFAVRAGLGFIGRHGLVISPEFGTRFNIGLLLTTLPLELSCKNNCQCPQDCDMCIKICPTGALRKGQPLDFSRCLSYLTQKKELNIDEEQLLAKGGQLYGCDICQNACKFNSIIEKTYVQPQKWLNKTDEDFFNEYGNTAMLWQGADILRRNAKLICSFLQSNY